MVLVLVRTCPSGIRWLICPYYHKIDWLGSLHTDRCRKLTLESDALFSLLARGYGLLAWGPGPRATQRFSTVPFTAVCREVLSSGRHGESLGARRGQCKEKLRLKAAELTQLAVVK